MSNRSAVAVGLLLSILIYELPSLLTLIKVGWEPVPPVLVADQNLYLNLSAIQHVSTTEVLNPWYGTRVLALDVPHLIFPITFFLFRMVHTVFQSWTLAVLVWTALWTMLTYVAAVFCLGCLFPNEDGRLHALLALALLVLQSPVLYVGELSQMIHSPTAFTMQLPYLRFAIPQVILPCVLGYWGLQARTLKSPSPLRLGGMALLQFFVCAAFPYFLPVLALGTGIACLVCGFCEETSGWTWGWTLVYATVCGVLDIGYVTLAGLGKSHANVHLGLQFRPETIISATRPYMLLLVAAAGLVLVSKAAATTKATAAGLALSSALFGFADVFFSPETQMLQHPNYIIGIVTWLTLFVCLRPFLQKLTSQSSRSLLFGALVAIAFWEAFSSFRMMLSVNMFQSDVASELMHLNANEQDLIVAPARFSDDVSSWIPLVSPARVLYTGDGENILSANDTRSIQTCRQAMYLMFSGMDLVSLQARTQDDSSGTEIGQLLQQTDRTYADSRWKADQVKLRRTLRDRMTPVFSELENEAQASGRVLNAYKRIFVIDNSAARTFDTAALSRWLNIQSSYEHKGVIVHLSYPRLRPQAVLTSQRTSDSDLRPARNSP